MNIGSKMRTQDRIKNFVGDDRGGSGAGSGAEAAKRRDALGADCPGSGTVASHCAGFGIARARGLSQAREWVSWGVSGELRLQELRRTAILQDGEQGNVQTLLESSRAEGHSDFSPAACHAN